MYFEIFAKKHENFGILFSIRIFFCFSYIINLPYRYPTDVEENDYTEVFQFSVEKDEVEGNWKATFTPDRPGQFVLVVTVDGTVLISQWNVEVSAGLCSFTLHLSSFVFRPSPLPNLLLFDPSTFGPSTLQPSIQPSTLHPFTTSLLHPFNLLAPMLTFMQRLLILLNLGSTHKIQLVKLVSNKFLSSPCWITKELLLGFVQPYVFVGCVGVGLLGNYVGL